MFGLIKEYYQEYLRFWTLLGAALLKPIEEISFRARRDGDFRNSLMFLGSAMATNAVFISLVAGESLGDIRRFVIFIITAASLSLFGFLSFFIAWRLVRYDGDMRLLMRMGFYINGIYVMIGAVGSVFFYGIFKLLNPALYKEYRAGLVECPEGFWVKVQQLIDLTGSDPNVSLLYDSYTFAVFFGLVFYWIASIRIYFQLFPMGRIRGTVALLIAIVLSWILVPLGYIPLIALGEAANGC